MTIDQWREVRDAVRPSAAAGQLTDMRAHQIANRYRVAIEDVRRIYGEEHARRHPQNPPAVAERSADEPTPPGDIPVPSPDQPAQAGGDAQVAPAVEPSDAPVPAGATVTVDPLTPGEMAKASDMALVSDAVLALSMLGDQPMPDKVRRLLDTAISDVQSLHSALREHHRTADLVAEQAVLLARLAEIRAALGEADTPTPEEGSPLLGGGRVPCPECGKTYYAHGLPRHRAVHRKQERGAA